MLEGLSFTAATLDYYQFTSPDGGTIKGYYLDKYGRNLGDNNGGAYFTLSVSSSALSELPNLDTNCIGVRVVVTGTVYQWFKGFTAGTGATDVGTYSDATAFGDAMPTSTFLNLGRVAY